MSTLRTLFLVLFSYLALPLLTSAHEVYVLDTETIERLKDTPSVSFFDIFLANTSDTIIWAAIVGFLIVSVFVISISATLESRFDGFLVKLKHFAPFISRITVGFAFISCAYYGAMFGPELQFSEMFGSYSQLVQVLFAVLGTLMVFGIFTRIAGLLSLTIFAVGVWYHGGYMVTYINYFSEFLVLILVGGHKFAVSDERPALWHPKDFFDYLANKYGEFSFLILRIGFGTSLIFSSVYAKIIHNQLAIEVVNEFNLVQVFGFSPEFIVFGAAIIEVLLGIMFILGIEIRFNAIVINIFLTLSLLYFGESVWPHIILIGIPIAFFCYGYDKYSLEGYFFKKGNKEPIF